MIPTQYAPRHYWRTNDVADLCFNEAGPEAPTLLSVIRTGHTGLVQSPTFCIPVAELQCIGRARFGEARGGQTKWTGDAYKFGIYRWLQPERYGDDRVVIIRNDGGGAYAYYVDQLDALATWDVLLKTVPEPRVWDVCMMLTHTYHMGVKVGRDEYAKAFLEGRMKKRKKRGVAYLEITAENWPGGGIR